MLHACTQVGAILSQGLDSAEPDNVHFMHMSFVYPNR